jgi:SAM-dependent methyltransferase
MAETSSATLAGLILELVRGHAATAPPPRMLPYLGLEHVSGTGLHLLDALSARGIFRKYEVVLDVGANLGATSRWLAARLGCEVVATTTSRMDAAAGALLTRRARLAGQVRFVPAVANALPFRAGCFTHVWVLETLARLPDAAAALVEAHRAVRRGGTLAIQELVTGDGTPPTVPGWRFVTVGARVAQLEASGFVDLDVRDRTAEAGERSAQVVAARARLLEQLHNVPAFAGLADERVAPAAALGDGALRVVQILARRA